MKRLHSCFVFMMFAVCILACAINGALGQDVAPNDPSLDAAESDPTNTENGDSSHAPTVEGNPAYDGGSDAPAEHEEVMQDAEPNTSSDPAPVSNDDSSPAPTDTPSDTSGDTSSSSGSDGLSGGAIAGIIGGSVAVLGIGAAAVTAMTKSNKVGVQRETRSKPLSMKERRDILLSK